MENDAIKKEIEEQKGGKMRQIGGKRRRKRQQDDEKRGRRWKACNLYANEALHKIG